LVRILLVENCSKWIDDVAVPQVRRKRGSMSTPANVFDYLPQHLPDELVQTLLSTKDLRIERIISQGHASPAGFWYDQDQHEWVMVLKGAARLLFDGTDKPIEMQAGDFVNIPAHKKHRVEWTTPDEPTVWLAIYYHNLP
jgi:cupin 2 domain-containing protein